MIFDKIKERRKIRSKIMGVRDKFRSETNPDAYDRYDIFLLNGDSIDDYIEHRIRTDKVLEGILKDIQGNIAKNEARQDRIEKLAHKMIKKQNL